MQPSLNLLPTIQQAISGLLLTYEPEFLRFGNRLFLSFATIIIVWPSVTVSPTLMKVGASGDGCR